MINGLITVNLSISCQEYKLRGNKLAYGVIEPMQRVYSVTQYSIYIVYDVSPIETFLRMFKLRDSNPMLKKNGVRNASIIYSE